MDTPLRPWCVDVLEAVRLQEELAKKVILEDRVGRIERVAGADVAYMDGVALAAVVVVTYSGLQILEEVVVESKVAFPYIPGLLGFREGPPLVEAIRSLKVRPDVILFDGQGIAHPRRLGIASHIGVLLDIPSIGCAKTRLHGEEDPLLGVEAGSISYIRKDGSIIGAKVRTKAGVRPLYVSPGHLVTTERAVEVVLHTTRGYRLPEPLRKAHLLAERAKRCRS